MIPVLGVPVVLRVDLLERMVRSIDREVETLFVIDNGGTMRQPLQASDIEKWSTDVQRVRVAQMPSNYGCAPSWNLIIKGAPFAPWWLICNDDIWFPKGTLEEMERKARKEALVLAGCDPPWSCFAIGEEVVEKVGLFDEGFVPVYFEDWDYERRCAAHNVDIFQSDVAVQHDPGSTIRSSEQFQERNRNTWKANERHYQDRKDRGALDNGEWNLAHRREFFVGLNEEFRRLTLEPMSMPEFDITEHLDTFADWCVKLDAQNVIELGVRRGDGSTIGFLYGLQATGGVLWSVDIDEQPMLPFDYPPERWRFIRGSDVDARIWAQLPMSVDIVFIDTSHTYLHTIAELALYLPLVRSGGVILLHDTNMEHHAGEYNYPVHRAVSIFCEAHSLPWSEVKNCQGLATIVVP